MENVTFLVNYSLAEIILSLASFQLEKTHQNLSFHHFNHIKHFKINLTLFQPYEVLQTLKDLNTELQNVMEDNERILREQE